MRVLQFFHVGILCCERSFSSTFISLCSMRLWMLHIHFQLTLESLWFLPLFLCRPIFSQTLVCCHLAVLPHLLQHWDISRFFWPRSYILSHQRVWGLLGLVQSKTWGTQFLGSTHWAVLLLSGMEFSPCSSEDSSPYKWPPWKWEVAMAHQPSVSWPWGKDNLTTVSKARLSLWT